VFNFEGLKKRLDLSFARSWSRGKNRTSWSRKLRSRLHPW